MGRGTDYIILNDTHPLSAEFLTQPLQHLATGICLETHDILPGLAQGRRGDVSTLTVTHRGRVVYRRTFRRLHIMSEAVHGPTKGRVGVPLGRDIEDMIPAPAAAQCLGPRIKTGQKGHILILVHVQEKESQQKDEETSPSRVRLSPEKIRHIEEKRNVATRMGSGQKVKSAGKKRKEKRKNAEKR